MSIFKRKGGQNRLEPEVEAEIYELVSRDVIEPRRQLANTGETISNNLGMLLDRVSETSVQEIDRLIDELQMLRQRLEHDGDRMAREIVGYASLSQEAIRSSQVIAENLTRWRKPAGRYGETADLTER